MLEVAGASIHALSYQQARNHRAKVGQVYIAEPGYLFGRAGVPKHAILTGLAGEPTPDLAAFARVLRRQPHGARTPVQFIVFGERNRTRTALLPVDRNWCALLGPVPTSGHHIPCIVIASSCMLGHQLTIAFGLMGPAVQPVCIRLP